MKPFIVGLKLWFRTVLINSILTGIGIIPAAFMEHERGFYIILVAALTLIAGFFIGIPLLFLISPFIKIALRLPYSTPARIGWLWFCLELFVVIYYLLLFYLAGLPSVLYSFFWAMLISTSIALVFSLLWTRKSLIKLNTQSHECNMV